MSKQPLTDPATTQDEHNPIWELALNDEDAVIHFIADPATNGLPDEKRFVFGDNEWALEELGMPNGGRSAYADSKSWTSWTPDPWQFHGSRTGELLAEIESIRLTAVRYMDGPHRKAYLRLTQDVQGRGWHTTGSQGRRPLAIILQVYDSSGGVILEFEYNAHVWCNTTKFFDNTWSINYDLWSLLSSAKMRSRGDGRFARC